MTVPIVLHGRELGSVFELLGTKENDITFSIGWALSQCPTLRRGLLARLLPEADAPDAESVRLQERGEGGVTDIELLGPAVHVIIEAKRGLALPAMAQLRRYAARANSSARRHRTIATLSEAGAAFTATRLPPAVDGVLCRHVSLRDIDALARDRGGSHAEKRLLDQLRIYLRRIARMQDLTSNMVYVVALSGELPEGSTLTWRDIVEKRGMYFHPVGGNYPREPVNYVGFRYDGRLQSVRHVEAWEVVSELGKRIPGCRHPLSGPHYLYTLGPPVVPSKAVRNGNIVMANRAYAAIDLLLTCDTISDAARLTRERLAAL